MIFCLRGQTPHTFSGVSRIQTGFLVGRFVFTPTQNVASKTFKEKKPTLMLFVLIVMIYYGTNALFSLKLPRGLCYTMMIYIPSLTQAIL